jgi:hypothetical protein
VQSSNSIEELVAVPQGANAKLLQVLGRQPREDRVVNIVLAEGRLVSFEAQAPQPLPEVHNFSFNSLPSMIVQRGQSVQRGRGMPKSESGPKSEVAARHDEVRIPPKPDIGSRIYEYTPY